MQVFENNTAAPIRQCYLAKVKSNSQALETNDETSKARKTIKSPSQYLLLEHEKTSFKLCIVAFEHQITWTVRDISKLCGARKGAYETI